MKIIEAMKEQKLILAKLRSNNENITKYASALSNEKLLLGEEKEHREEIKKLMQSSDDLITRYVFLKTRIDYTNLKTVVHTVAGDFTIAQLLVFKRSMNEWKGMLYNSLNDSAATGRKRMIAPQAGTEVQVLSFFDSKKIDQQKRGLMDFHGSIDGTLEVINATTDIIEEIL